MKDILFHVEETPLKKDQYMTDLYPEGMPTDTIIHKTLTGIRATTCEIEAPRHSIIVVPNVPVIEGKQNKYSDILVENPLLVDPCSPIKTDPLCQLKLTPFAN